MRNTRQVSLPVCRPHVLRPARVEPIIDEVRYWHVGHQLVEAILYLVDNLPALGRVEFTGLGYRQSVYLGITEVDEVPGASGPYRAA